MDDENLMTTSNIYDDGNDAVWKYNGDGSTDGQDNYVNDNDGNVHDPSNGDNDDTSVNDNDGEGDEPIDGDNVYATDKNN